MNENKQHRTRKLCGKTGSVISMMGLTASFFLVEVIVGYATNSMALVADSFHMLSDVVSLVIGFLALRYSKRSQRTERNTFGWQRAEVLGALVNAVFLIALCFSILVESMKRLVSPEEIYNPVLILIVGGAGLLVNLIGMALFYKHGHGHSHGGGGSRHGHSHGGGKKKHNSPVRGIALINGDGAVNGNGRRLSTDSSSSCSDSIEPSVKQSEDLFLADDKEVTIVDKDKCKKSKKKVQSGAQLNMRGVYLHVLGDALGSVIVIISALIIKYATGDWTLYVDPAMSIMMVMLILKTSIPLLRESALILLQTVPTHIKIKEVQDRLLEQVDGVLSVHEFHVWQLAGDKIIASAHVTCRSSDDYMGIANSIKKFFHDEGIHSTTIQPEFVRDHESDVSSDKECVLECGLDQNCAAQKCCPGDGDLRKRLTVDSVGLHVSSV